MLPKQYRLKKNEIKNLFKKSNIIKNEFFLIYFIRNNCNYSRCAIIIPNTISKKSSLRNRLKRRIRAILIKYILRKIIGLDFIIMVKKGIENKTFKDFQKYLLEIFNKIGFTLDENENNNHLFN